MYWSKTVAKSGAPIKILIGGSPCTKWSIAQKNGREVLPEGIGWELFENYRIAKEKFQPDIFLYENNKSAAQPIKDAIYTALGGGVDDRVRLTHINSASVSAQNRERFYVTNFGNIEQPKDRGILLRDVLESEWITDRKKARTVLSSVGRTTTREYFGHSQNTMVYYQLESVIPINTTADGKARTIKAQYHYSGMANFVTNGGFPATGVATPIRIGTIESGVKNKSHDSKQYRVYSPDGKATTLCGQGGGVGAKTGLYACPTNEIDGKPIYTVKDGLITVKDKQCPVKLQDGYYLIRKLTPVECERLQTMPDGYTAAVSNSQRYKALGNGWTAEVIIHILNHALKDVPRDEKLVVLSMYDGIATGRYCLDKMGFTNVKYYAYEIDPYPIKIAMSNYPDIIQCGDAFRVRDDDWKIPD